MDIIDIIEIICIFVILVLSIFSFYFTLKTKRRYEKIALKLGNGEDITSIIGKYVTQVEEIKIRDQQLINYCNNIDRELSKTIQKVGLYRYDAYSNTKNKLSFALALLNRDNTGVVLNSIYGIDDSNIYAKPVNKGTCRYNLSFEEQEAINIAIDGKN
ncbi:MAG: DUF4446 family protein [Clostridia bacterium]|nr:DUF4446 family protein [Clostridia bacterium]